jgi:VanZ family protein
VLEYLDKHKKKLIYIPLIIYWIILLTATSLPGNDVPDFHVSDKIEHFTGYAVLTIFLCFTLMLQSKFQFMKKHAYIITLLMVSVYGALDELHQLFIPGRSCDIRDWIADTSAAYFGVLVVFVIVKGVHYRLKKS